MVIVENKWKKKAFWQILLTRLDNMSNYGRRTWDKDEYTLLAEEGQFTHEQSLKSTLTEAQLQHLKTKYTDYHCLMQDTIQNLNRKTLVTGLSSYKKGKQFGFYCELCNLTFKDTLQYIDHLNHKTHQIKFEAIFDEPLVNEMRDNDEIKSEEFEDVYSETINNFVSKHATKNKRHIKKSNLRQGYRLREKPTTTNSSKDLESVMGFKSFETSKK